jgi:hypothetical protein
MTWTSHLLKIDVLPLEAQQLPNPTEITVDADIRSPFRYRCVTWNGRMLLSNLLSRLPVHSGHKVKIVPDFESVRGYRCRIIKAIWSSSPTSQTSNNEARTLFLMRY